MSCPAAWCDVLLRCYIFPKKKSQGERSLALPSRAPKKGWFSCVFVGEPPSNNNLHFATGFCAVVWSCFPTIDLIWQEWPHCQHQAPRMQSLKPLEWHVQSLTATWLHKSIKGLGEFGSKASNLKEIICYQNYWVPGVWFWKCSHYSNKGIQLVGWSSFLVRE